VQRGVASKQELVCEQRSEHIITSACDEDLRPAASRSHLHTTRSRPCYINVHVNSTTLKRQAALSKPQWASRFQHQRNMHKHMHLHTSNTYRDPCPTTSDRRWHAGALLAMRTDRCTQTKAHGWLPSQKLHTSIGRDRMTFQLMTPQYTLLLKAHHNGDCCHEATSGKPLQCTRFEQIDQTCRTRSNPVHGNQKWSSAMLLLGLARVLALARAPALALAAALGVTLLLLCPQPGNSGLPL
jgi:hypothetical protein